MQNEKKTQLTVFSEEEKTDSQKIIIKSPGQNVLGIFIREVEKGILHIISLFFQIAAVCIVILFLYNYANRKNQPVTSFFQATFNDLKYKTYLLTNPDAVPSKGTFNNKPLPGFPMIDEILYLEPNSVIYQTDSFQVVFKRTEVSKDTDYEEEKNQAILQKQWRKPNMVTEITDFLNKEKNVFAHQYLRLGNESWFIYKVLPDQLILGRFVNKEEAQQFPLVWEVM